MTEEEEVAPGRAQDDPLDTKLKAGISQERDPSDFGIAKTIGILFAVTETSGEKERPGRAVVVRRLAMTGNVIGMTGVIGRADAVAPGPRVAIESVTGLIAVIDANETEIVNVIGAVIGSETETATEKEKGIGIVEGTATETEIETVTGTVTAS